MRSKQFGGKLTKAWLSIYQASPHWMDGSFKNLVETQSAINWRDLPGILCKQIKGHKEGYPKSNIPFAPFDKEKFLTPSKEAKFIWYGHSVLLLRMNHQTILIDPMFGPDASPIGPKRTKRFSTHTLEIIDQLPDIDLVLISHDHYDHLDYQSMQRLKKKARQFYVALGVKRHLVYWGFDADLIEEFDWWDNQTFRDIEITFTPTRHFSGRGITSIAKCMWGGWALKTESENVWFSGDSGYADHFVEIGKRLGPFDIGFMECGQYCPDWAQIHMFPEETVNAALDAKVNIAVPVHWGGFNLSYHHAWYEPGEEFVKFAKQKGLAYQTPSPGEIFSVQHSAQEWWKELK